MLDISITRPERQDILLNTRTCTCQQRAPGMRRAPFRLQQPSRPPSHPLRLPSVAVLRVRAPAGAGCRSTGSPGAARPSASLLCKWVTRGRESSGEGTLPRPRVPLAQRSAAARQILQQLHCMQCSTAACLHGVGMATTCGSSGPRRQPQSHQVRTDGCDLPRCSLSRPYTIRPQVDSLCSCSQEAAQVGAGPMPRRHAAMLQPYHLYLRKKHTMVSLAHYLHQQLRYIATFCRAGCHVITVLQTQSREEWHNNL